MLSPTSSPFWRDRLKASAIHLTISLVVALLAAFLVFGVWYPYPYREMSGGRELFLLVVSVDVVMGPLITLIIFNRSKSWRELRTDLTLVGVMQLAALCYGLWTVSVARPVHLVFEVDRFRVVHAIEVPTEMLSKAPEGIDPLPLTGPTMLSLRPFRDSNESMEATMAALQGASLGSRPDLWQSYAAGVPQVLAAVQPVSALKKKFANRAAEIDGVIAAVGRKPQDVVYLPLVARTAFWTVFLDPVTAAVVATMPLDPF